MAVTFLVQSVHLFTLVWLTVFESFLEPHTHISMRTSGSERRNLYRNEKVRKFARPTTEICRLYPWELFSRRSESKRKECAKRWFISTKSIRLCEISWVSEAVLQFRALATVLNAWIGTLMDSCAMLATKSSAGVALEVNLRNLSVQVRKHASQALADSPAWYHQGYQWSHEKDLRPAKIFEKFLLSLKPIS